MIDIIRFKWLSAFTHSNNCIKIFDIKLGVFLSKLVPTYLVNDYYLFLSGSKI